MRPYVKPTSDIFIRFLFGSEQNKEILLNFINAVLLDADFKPIESVEILNPFNLQQFLNDKESILDIKAKSSDGRVYNIEIQAFGNREFVHRSLYYWARSYTAQLESAEDYMRLNPVICINILDFSLIRETDKTHTVFLPLEKNNPDLRLSEHFEIHFIEIPKFNEKASQLKADLNHWLLYLRKEGKEVEDMRTILEHNPALQKAHEQYEKFTCDDRYLEAYEARLKAERDEKYHLRIAREEGESRGELTARLETARNMIKEGFEIPVITRITGLTEEDLRQAGLVQ